MLVPVSAPLPPFGVGLANQDLDDGKVSGIRPISVMVCRAQ